MKKMDEYFEKLQPAPADDGHFGPPKNGWKKSPKFREAQKHCACFLGTVRGYGFVAAQEWVLERCCNRRHTIRKKIAAAAAGVLSPWAFLRSAPYNLQQFAYSYSSSSRSSKHGCSGDGHDVSDHDESGSFFFLLFFLLFLFFFCCCSKSKFATTIVAAAIVVCWKRFARFRPKE